MARVEIGSSAEQGSSISSTDGSTAIARAMQSRCCCPPDRPGAGPVEPLLDLFPQVRARSERSTMSSISLLDFRVPAILYPAMTLS